MSANYPTKDTTESLETINKTRLNNGDAGLTENAKFRPITDLWKTNQPPATGQFVKECLSCDRWAGTTVAGGGLYLLWKARQAPTKASALLMVTFGGVMAVGGIYQGWINHFVTVQNSFEITQTENSLECPL